MAYLAHHANITPYGENKVKTRYVVRGTHKDGLQGIPPMDKQPTLTATEIYRLADGRIAEQWVNLDTLGVMQQPGVIPEPR